MKWLSVHKPTAQQGEYNLRPGVEASILGQGEISLTRLTTLIFGICEKGEGL